MKAIEIGQTYDLSDLTGTGLVFHLRRRRSGRYFVSAIYHTRWQGARAGESWEMDLTPGLTLAEAEAEAQDIFESFCDIEAEQGFILLKVVIGDDVIY